MFSMCLSCCCMFMYGLLSYAYHVTHMNKSLHSVSPSLLLLSQWLQNSECPWVHASWILCFCLKLRLADRATSPAEEALCPGGHVVSITLVKFRKFSQTLKRYSCQWNHKVGNLPVLLHTLNNHCLTNGLLQLRSRNSWNVLSSPESDSLMHAIHCVIWKGPTQKYFHHCTVYFL